MTRRIGLLCSVAVVGCGGLDAPAAAVILEGEPDSSISCRSTVATDGYTLAYCGSDPQALIANNAFFDSSPDVGFVAARLSPTIVEQARARLAEDAEDQVITLSLCDPANDMAMAHTFVRGDSTFELVYFIPGEPLTTGRVGIAAHPDEPTQTLFWYAAVKGIHYDEGSTAWKDVACISGADPTPEDPLVDDCNP
jgi:hypothetical protein